MTAAAQPLSEDDGPLSPWWIRSILIVMAVGFTGIIPITTLAYHHVHPQILPGRSSPGQDALVKFFVVVALLLVAQTLVGSAVDHYRADPGTFYGFDLSRTFPSNLLLT